MNLEPESREEGKILRQLTALEQVVLLYRNCGSQAEQDLRNCLAAETGTIDHESYAEKEKIRKKYQTEMASLVEKMKSLHLECHEPQPPGSSAKMPFQQYVPENEDDTSTLNPEEDAEEFCTWARSILIELRVRFALLTAGVNKDDTAHSDFAVDQIITQIAWAAARVAAAQNNSDVGEELSESAATRRSLNLKKAVFAMRVENIELELKIIQSKSKFGALKMKICGEP